MRVVLDKKKHVCTVEIKLATNIGVLYRAKPLYYQNILKTIYLFYVWTMAMLHRPGFIDPDLKQSTFIKNMLHALSLMKTN